MTGRRTDSVKSSFYRQVDRCVRIYVYVLCNPSILKKKNFHEELFAQEWQHWQERERERDQSRIGTEKGGKNGNDRERLKPKVRVYIIIIIIYTGGGGRWGSGRAGRGQGWWGGWGCDWGGSCGGGGGRYRSNRFRRHKDDVGPSLYAHTAVCTARPPPLPTHNLSSTSLARTVVVVVVVGVYYVYDSDKNWRRTDTV